MAAISSSVASGLSTTTISYSLSFSATKHDSSALLSGRGRDYSMQSERVTTRTEKQRAPAKWTPERPSDE